ncbi:hypothetical protein [Pengzhenrongella phosphoraccumulans]|uniref:hypothetical protein n=1 Tax=Pengzhenrongella phosphoraccumulans TaxID=3114394 RepID=UPI00388FC00B
MNQATSALIGYAVLRANFDAAAPSYLDNFSPYVLDVLDQRFPESIDEHKAAAEVRENFGFGIPDRVVGVLLKRAVKAGYAQRSSGPHGRFVATEKHAHAAGSISADIARFSRRQAELVEKYRAFIEGTLSSSSELLAGDLVAQIDGFIESHAVPLLRQALKGGPGSDSTELRGSNYAVSRFVAHLAEQDNTAFGYVEEAVKGAILAAVVGLDTSRFKESLKNVTGFLDTPVLLKALGYQGETQERAVLETLELARSLGMKISCFQHSVREVDGVLLSAQAAIRAAGRRSGALREVDVYFQDAGMTAADIEIERAKIDNSLKVIGIRSQSKPDGYYSYGLDETALDALLAHHINYSNAGARRYDVDSLSAIHRLREGSSPEAFERCGFVLVTDNAAVARASRQVDERHGWPLAMVDGDLAAFLWARSPGVADDLPRRQLLATVYAGVQPGRHLWTKYLAEIERLQERGEIREDEAIVLRSRPEARQALMDLTLGEEDVVLDSAAAVLVRVRSDLENPLLERLGAEQEARQKAEDRAHADAESAESSQRRLSAQVAEATRTVEDLMHDRSQQDHRIRVRAGVNSRRILDIPVIIGAVIAIGFAMVYFFAPPWLSGAPRWMGHAVFWGAALVFVAAALQPFTPGTVLDWIGPIRVRVAAKLERRYRRTAGLPAASSEVPTQPQANTP